MDAKVKDFVNAYSRPKKNTGGIFIKTKVSIKQLFEESSDEIWRKCTQCGNEEDLRIKWICSSCDKILFEPK